MVTIEEAESQLTQAKADLAARRQETSKAKEQLTKAKESLPSRTSQQALRSKLSGLAGRTQRQKIYKIEKEIEGKQQLVSGIESDLTKFETEQIKPVEAQISDYRAREAAIKQVERAADKDMVWALAAFGEGYVRKYAKEWLEQQSMARESFERDVANIESTLPEGEKLVVDLKNMRISGVQSSALGQTVSVKDYNKQIEKLNIDMKNIVPSIQNLQVRTDLTSRDLGSISKVNKLDRNFLTGGSIFPIVSASPVSDYTSLNILDTRRVNDTSISDRFINGKVIGVDSNIQPRTGIGGFLSDLFRGGKEGYKEVTQKEIYIPSLGGFASARQVFEGGSQTLIIRPVTQIEQEKITQANIKGNILSRSPTEIYLEAKQFKDLTKDFGKLEGQELTKRVQELRNAGIQVQEIQTNEGTSYQVVQPTVGLGFGLNKRQISISELDTRRPTRVTASAISLLTGKVIEEQVGKVLPEKGIYTIPEKEVIVKDYQKFGTLSYDPLTGSPITFKEQPLTIPEQNILAPRQFGKVGEVATRAVLFVPEETLTYGGYLAEQQGGLKGFGLGTFQYVKESPIEAATIITIGALKGASLLGKASRLSKEAKYLSTPEAKVISLQDDFIKNIDKTRNIKTRVEVISADATKTSIIEKVKGTTTVTEFYPKNVITGKVVEVRKPGLFRKPKPFEGTIEVFPEGGFKESVKFGDDILRVTEVGKEGTGTIKLFKAGKEVSSEAVKQANVLDDILKQTKVKTETIKVDRQLNQPLQITETSLTGKGGKTIKQTKVLEGADDFVYVGEKIKPKVSKKVSADINVLTKRFEDIQSGRFRFTQEAGGITDIIKVGERKGLVRVKTPSGEVLVKRRLGQTIETGLDTTKDIVVTSFADDILKQRKIITPKVEREVQSFAGTDVVEVFLKPGTKSQKAIELAQQAKIKASKEFASKADDIQKIIGENIKLQDELLAPKPSVSRPNIPLVEEKQILQKVGGTESEFAFGGTEFVKTLAPLEEITFVPAAKSFITTRAVQELPKTFEVVRETAEQVFKPVFKQMFPLVGAKTDLRIDTDILSAQAKVDTKVRQEQLLKVDTKLDTRLDQRMDMRLDQRLDQRLDSRLDQKLNQKMDMKLETKVSTKQVLKNLLESRVTKQKKETKTEPKLTFKPKITQKQETKVAPKGAPTVELFKVFARKKGEDIEIGTARTEEEAFSLLGKRLRGTIAASGFVERAGEKIKPITFGTEFTTGKKDQFRVVQKRERRLSARSEVSEIKMFKKQKTKKGFF